MGRAHSIVVDGCHRRKRFFHLLADHTAVILHQICAGQAVAVRGIHGWDRSTEARGPDIFGLLGMVLNERWRHNTASMLGRNGFVWVAHIGDVAASCVVTLGQIWGHKHLVPRGRHGMHRITGRCSDTVAGVRRRERCQHRLAEVVLAAPDHRRQRFLDVVYPWGLSLSFSIAGRDDIRLAALDGEFIHAADDSPHGVVRQRPHRLQIVPLLDFLLGVEDGRAR